MTYNKYKRPLVILNGRWVNYQAFDLIGHVQLSEVPPNAVPFVTFAYRDKRLQYKSMKVSFPDTTLLPSGRLLIRLWFDG
jgi:hypothetical protein